MLSHRCPESQCSFALWAASVFPALLFADLEEPFVAKVLPALPTFPP